MSPRCSWPPRRWRSKLRISTKPPNAPGAGQKLLAQFVGNWDVVKTFFPRNGPPRVSKGWCRQYMVQDGEFLESDFTFSNPDGTRGTDTGISGFDSKTNRFTTVWFDSRQTTMSIRQSDGTFDGKNIVLYATALDPDDPGRKTVARAHLEDNGRVLLHRRYFIDDKGNERLMIELRITRKSLPPAQSSRFGSSLAVPIVRRVDREPGAFDTIRVIPWPRSSGG
ncbi:MAG TPA: DUF1579 family protein [Acidobacteriaceae bacterium]|nr:DUF1579 family protein [Acidobacteriaceae bacterium]